MKPLCIYHDKCADGFTSAWAVRSALGDDVEFFPGVYQDPPPDVTGRDVIMVDFSYKRPVLEKMAETARSILILDHHESAQEDLKDFVGIPFTSTLREEWERSKLGDASARKINAHFDMGKSGALLTWEFFHPGMEPPLLVRYVSDRDLWQFKLPNSRDVNAWVFAHDYDFRTWDRLDAELVADFSNVLVAGSAIEMKHRKDVAELVETFKRRMRIGGLEVWVANLPYTLTSDAGALMAKGEPFAACYWDVPEGRVFSLRSVEGGLNVAKIAAMYGGGGHAKAAGFRLPHGQEP